MGKNHRHKKNLKSDKAKVKLKITKTKFLPKGLNVTDTSFKIKPIVLPEQLKEKDPNVALSKRKLNYTDLLSRIKHYNENVRHDACEELSEMIKIHTDEAVNHYLSQIILNVSSLVQDKERKVRRSAVKTVDAILLAVPANKLRPFYNYFVKYLCCAMTHIDRNIQEDTLLFLDCFLKHDCELIRNYSEKLLNEFFSLISKLKSDSSLDRTLILNLGSDMTTASWRIKVLNRLNAILEMVFKKSVFCGKLSSDKMCVVGDQFNRFPLYKKGFDWWDIEDDKYPDQNNFLNTQIGGLVPLLYEMFIEVIPERNLSKSITESTNLTEDGAMLLSNVMSTLYLLWKYSSSSNNPNLKKIFFTSQARKCFKQILANFPYRKNEGNLKKKLKIISVTDKKCTKENILICYLYLVFNVTFSQKFEKNEVDCLLIYINKLLLTKSNLSEDILQYLMELLKFCLVDHFKLLKNSGLDLRTLLYSVIKFFNFHDGAKMKIHLLKILTHIIDIEFLRKTPDYDSWLKSLPNMLCKPKIFDVIVEALLLITKKDKKVFQKALIKKLPEILSNLANCTIILTKPSLLNTEYTVKRNIVYMFFYIDDLSPQHLEDIRKFCVKHSNSKFSEYFNEMLNFRSELRIC